MHWTAYPDEGIDCLDKLSIVLVNQVVTFHLCFYNSWKEYICLLDYGTLITNNMLVGFKLFTVFLLKVSMYPATQWRLCNM